jgi:hypothetical protein
MVFFIVELRSARWLMAPWDDGWLVGERQGLVSNGDAKILCVFGFS